MAPELERLRLRERRTRWRYPLELPLRYTVLNKRHILRIGCGKTLNISSGGVGFLSECELAAGSTVELCISWPAITSIADTVELRVSGEIVHSDGLQAGLRMKRHQFWVRRARTSQPAA